MLISALLNYTLFVKLIMATCMYYMTVQFTKYNKAYPLEDERPDSYFMIWMIFVPYIGEVLFAIYLCLHNQRLKDYHTLIKGRLGTLFFWVILYVLCSWWYYYLVYEMGSQGGFQMKYDDYADQSSYYAVSSFIRLKFFVFALVAALGGIISAIFINQAHSTRQNYLYGKETVKSGAEKIYDSLTKH